MAGGLSWSREFNRITADMYDRSVTVAVGENDGALVHDLADAVPVECLIRSMTQCVHAET